MHDLELTTSRHQPVPTSLEHPAAVFADFTLCCASASRTGLDLFLEATGGSSIAIVRVASVLPPRTVPGGRRRLAEPRLPLMPAARAACPRSCLPVDRS